jgi:hypothetical protein
MGKTEESTINLESQKQLLAFIRSKDRLHSPNHKVYYLASAVKAAAGIEERALEHLTISLEVLRSCSELALPEEPQIRRFQLHLPQLPRNLSKKTLVLDLD